MALKRAPSGKLPYVGELHDHVAPAPGYNNEAILRCCNAWNETYVAKTVAGEPIVASALAANEAFRNAMPPLSGPQNICDFIACVGQGMIIGAICNIQADDLLNAAKIALRASQIAAIDQKNKEIAARRAKKSKNRNTRAVPLYKGRKSSLVH